jgi:hypothetical protein
MKDVIIRVFEITGAVTKQSVHRVIELCDYETKEHHTDHDAFRKQLVELKKKCTI